VDASQRPSDLVEVLRRDGRVDAATAKFGTAELTIRRDLDVLVERGVARRVRGGAVNLLPRRWPGFRSSGGVQCRWAGTRPGTGHRRGHRVSLRIGQIRLRPTGHRALVRMGVAARRLGSAPPFTAFVVAGTLTSSALGTGRQLRARAQCATAR
jgi:hypothetical protein